MMLIEAVGVILQCASKAAWAVLLVEGVVLLHYWIIMAQHCVGMFS
jgi:hypothetical protein